jgi:hypothetical protein
LIGGARVLAFSAKHSVADPRGDRCARTSAPVADRRAWWTGL